MIEFREFPKIARLSRDIIVTEKIDGTNASVYISEDGEILFGSRTKWITPILDNFGFARWGLEHKDELMQLGPGHHFGEWWGAGIQRKYGLKEKRFSLFNVIRWCHPKVDPVELIPGKMQTPAPACCDVVPVLYVGPFNTEAINDCLWNLLVNGSHAVPDFMDPEGIVVYHTAGSVMFKKTIKNDDEPKSKIRT